VVDSNPALGRPRKDFEFKASLDYIARPYLKNKTNKKPHKSFRKSHSY
jgi:hypothetical protein